MLNRRWIAGTILGAFLTVTAGAFAPQMTEASALTPPAIKTEASTVELAKHHGPDKHDKFDRHDRKHDKHKKFDKKHDRKHDKHKKYGKHKKHDRHDRDRHDRHHKPMPPRR